MIFVYGGSFDPPHLGHKNLVMSLVLFLNPLDFIFLIPNYYSPIKDKKLFTPNQIWNFCQLTFESLLSKQVLLLDWELKKEEKSFTIQTLRKIRKEYPEQELSLVLGEDSLENFENWQCPEEIVSLVSSILVFRRWTAVPNMVPLVPELLKSKVRIMENPLWTVSSTDIRNGLFSPKEIEERVLLQLNNLGFYSKLEA